MAGRWVHVDTDGGDRDAEYWRTAVWANADIGNEEPGVSESDLTWTNVDMSVSSLPLTGG